MNVTERIEKKILWLSFGAGSVFAIGEFLMAIYSQSQSVLMDAAYDASELIIIGLTLFLTPLFHKPVSEKRPFGYSQVESIFVIIKGFMMLSVTLGLSVSSIQLALSGGNHVDASQISLFQLALGAVSLCILLVMMRLNRSISSPTITAEIYGWKLDVAYSIGMSLAFFASTFFEGTKLEVISPYFDQIIALLVVIFMLPEAIRMLWRAIKDVFLFSPETETMDAIKETCGDILSQYNFEPVFFDVTRTGRRIWVSVYFTIAEEALSIEKLREADERVSSALSEQIENCYSELVLTASSD